ncbi:GNAT family N-acetyltransferase [Sphingomonas sp. MMS24-J45]|uniref:GNAT family N-acetyltransferase n=1 Tax=Sphingomonas sp. MMS24-J45 TaxID=3238806 RepID=UPI00384BF8BA
MFARTPRLTLRPGWLEDAPALTQAIAHYDVACMLSRLPWPYAQADAEAWLSRPPSAEEVNCLILAHGGDYPTLVGGISIILRDGEHEIGYWLTPSARGRGFATEAGHAMLGIARYAMGLDRLSAKHFVDNPASGRVLAKLGFRPTGETLLHSVARGAEAPCATLERTFGPGADAALQLAA